jgi:hypothetical protein
MTLNSLQVFHIDTLRGQQRQFPYDAGYMSMRTLTRNALWLYGSPARRAREGAQR